MRNRTIATPVLLALICSSVFVVTLAQSPGRYTVSGELHDEKGQPFFGATVCAIPIADPIVRVRDRICTVSDEHGKFVINLTQSGKYQVVGDKPSLGYMPAYMPFHRDPHTPIPEVVVGDDNPNPSVSPAFGPKSGLITGKVIDEAADTPIQNFEVWVWQLNDKNARYHEVVKGTNSPGRFKLFAPPVSFRMRIESEGYEDWEMGGGVLISRAGPRKGPGALMMPPGSTAEFAVYMKRKKPSAINPPKNGDEKRLPAPAQMTPADNAIIDSFPRMTRLEWTPVPGAVAYGVEVEACNTPYRSTRAGIPDDGECINPSPFLERLRLAGTTIEFPFRGAQPGRWRVWAIGKDQRQGLKSPWRRFVHLQ